MNNPIPFLDTLAVVGAAAHSSSWTLLVFATLLAGAALKFLLRRPTLDGVPVAPGASWIWGHEKTVFMNNTGAAYTQWCTELNSLVFKVKGALLKRDILVVSDPTAVSYIMGKNVYDYPHSSVVRPRIARMLGKSLGWVEGQAEHKRMRQLVAPALSTETIKAGEQGVYDAAETLRAALDTALTAERGSCSKRINIYRWTIEATLDVIGRFAFAHDFEGGRSSQANGILDAWANMAKMATSKTGFYTLVLLRRFRVLNNIPLKALSAQAKVRLTIHDGIGKALLERDSLSAAERKTDNDLLSRLLAARSKNLITHEELLDHISMFIVGGSETTAQSVASAIWELARFPEIQERLRKELQSFADQPSYDQIQNQMPYLDAVTRETLRLHPAGPYLERVAEKEDVIPLGVPLRTKNGRTLESIRITPGQTVIIPILCINSVAAIWGVDGANFRPERWLEPLRSPDLLPRGWSNTLTFSEGPRHCPGFRLSIFEIKVMLFTLIRNFHFADTGEAIRTRFASSTNPLLVGKEDLGPMLPVRICKVDTSGPRVEAPS